MSSILVVRFIEMRALVKYHQVWSLPTTRTVLVYALGLPEAVANPPRPRLPPKGDEDDPRG